ncbi:unnamed protein product [Brassica oleracea var. botrytis]
MLYHSIATWTASISPTIVRGTLRLFLNATSGRQLYFDKETNAEETYFTSKLNLSGPMKVTGFNMDKGWCYVSCSRCTKKLQRTVSSFTWQPAVTPMQLVSFDMLDPKMRSHRHISN